MKKFWILAFAAFALFSCKDDDPVVDFDPDLMHFDGANANSPFLPTGTNQVGVKFDQSTLELYQGEQIEAIQIFTYSLPNSALLVIYGPGTGDEPGNVLFQKDITNDLQPDGWNVIPLDTAMDVPNDELWVSLTFFTTSPPRQVIGCDSGPAVDGGDWLSISTNDWTTFREESGDSINWNIRCQIKK